MNFIYAVEIILHLNIFFLVAYQLSLSAIKDKSNVINDQPAKDLPRLLTQVYWCLVRETKAVY